MSHVDALYSNQDTIIVFSHLMLLIVSFAETTIDVKIADCFDKISSHYERVSNVYRKAKTGAIVIFVVNVLFTLSDVAHYGEQDYPFLKLFAPLQANIYTLSIIIIADFLLLLWLRYKISDLRLPSWIRFKGKESKQ